MRSASRCAGAATVRQAERGRAHDPQRSRAPVVDAGVRIEYTPQLDGDPDPGEVVWTWVPYEDDPTPGKDRPVVDHRPPRRRCCRRGADAKHERPRRQVEVGTGPWDSRGPAELRQGRPAARHRPRPRCAARARSSSRRRFDAVVEARRRAPRRRCADARRTGVNGPYRRYAGSAVGSTDGVSCDVRTIASACSAAATSAPRSSSSVADAGQGRSRPAPARLEVDPGRRAQPVAATATSSSPDGVLTRDAHGVVADPDIDLVVEVIGGIEPARELITAALAGRQAGRHGEQGAARQRRRRAVRRRRRGRRRPAVRGRRRRRHPARPRPAREPARRADPPGDRHRQRHDQLHPHQDDRGGRRLRRGARRGAAARLRRARPDRRRRGLRRRRQGGDHRHRSRSAPRSSPATSTTRASAASPPPTSPSPAASATSSSCSRIAERDAGSGEVAVRVHPAMVPDPPSAGQRPRELQRRVRRGRRGRLADVLRPRRRRAADGQRRARRRHRRRRQPHQGHARLARHVRQGARSGRSTRRRPSTSSASRSPTSPACCTPSPACSPTTASASAPPSRRASAPTPGSCSSPTRRKEAAVQATRARACATSTSCSSVGGLLRVDRRLSVTAMRYVSTRGAGARARVRRRAARRAGRRRRAVRARRRGRRCRPSPSSTRPATPTPPPASWRPFVGDDIDAGRRSTALCDDAYATFRHPAVVPARPDRRPPVAARAVPRPDAGVQGRRPAARRPAVRPRARPSAASGSRSSAPRAATPARRRSTACTDCANVDIVILYPDGAVERGAAPADDDGRRAERPRRRRRGHVRRLPGPREGDVRRRRRSASELRLSAVNSINWARVMAQTVYYVTTAAGARRPDHGRACRPATSATSSPAGSPAGWARRSPTSSSPPTPTTSSPASSTTATCRSRDGRADAQPEHGHPGVVELRAPAVRDERPRRRPAPPSSCARFRATGPLDDRGRPARRAGSAGAFRAARVDDDDDARRDRAGSTPTTGMLDRPAHRDRHRAPPGCWRATPSPGRHAGHRPPGEVPRRRRAGHRGPPGAARPPRRPVRAARAHRDAAERPGRRRGVRALASHAADRVSTCCAERHIRSEPRCSGRMFATGPRRRYRASVAWTAGSTPFHVPAERAAPGATSCHRGVRHRRSRPPSSSDTGTASTAETPRQSAPGERYPWPQRHSNSPSSNPRTRTSSSRSPRRSA